MLQAALVLVAPQGLSPVLALDLVPGPLVCLLPPLPFPLTPGILRSKGTRVDSGLIQHSVMQIGSGVCL